jgi:primosomal protein N' (replication factor Y)
MDRDSIKTAHDWQTLNEAIYQGQPGILLGTQMLAKGHDFPNVTLTGIIDADSGLFSADFRAFERTAQLLTQVSGRAGRRQHRAEVLVQTRLPDHPLLNQFLEQDYLTLAHTLLAQREPAAMPPFSHLALIRADHAQADTALQFLQTLQSHTPLAPGVYSLGPMPALMNRRAGLHRMIWQLKAAARKPLHQTLMASVRLLHSQLKVPSGLSWSIDVDPIEF